MYSNEHPGVKDFLRNSSAQLGNLKECLLSLWCLQALRYYNMNMSWCWLTLTLILPCWTLHTDATIALQTRSSLSNQMCQQQIPTNICTEASMCETATESKLFCIIIMITIMIIIIKWDSSSASDFAYSYSTHFSVAWSVCLSVVCHIHAPCLNHSTGLHFAWSSDTLC